MVTLVNTWENDTKCLSLDPMGLGLRLPFHHLYSDQLPRLLVTHQDADALGVRQRRYQSLTSSQLVLKSDGRQDRLLVQEIPLVQLAACKFRRLLCLC